MKMKTTMPQMVHCPFEQGLSRTGPTLNSNAAETNNTHAKPESIRYSRDKPPEDNTIKFLDTDYAQPTETSNIDAETAKTRTKYHKQIVFSKHEAEYPNYYEDKLLRAGDVETHPGPSAKYITTGTNHVHLIAIAILLILLINKIQQYSRETAKDSQKYQSEGLLSGANLLRLKTKHFYRKL